MKHLLLTTIAVTSLLATTAFADPIHDAARDGDIAGVEALLDAGVDVNAKEENGMTPLHYAAQYGRKEIVELLIDEGAEVNAKDEDGWTPLHEAAHYGRKEIVELLIASDAEVNAKDNDGRTPLDFAGGATAELLLKHGGKSDSIHVAVNAPLGGFVFFDPSMNTSTRAFMPLLVYSNDQLAIDGWIGLKYEVLYSSDLKEWQVLETITLETSPQVYVDKTATEQPMRFYQLRLID